MNNPVDQPKVSELDAGAFEAAKRVASGTNVGWVEGLRLAITAYLAALPQPQVTTVGVKALEWTQKAPPGHEHEAFVYWAAGLGGHYKAERDGLLWMAHDAFVWKQYASQKEAKAAAQADFDTRIRSALIPGAEKGDADQAEIVKNVAIYTVEDEGDHVYLTAFGTRLGCWQIDTPEAIAVLKLCTILRLGDGEYAEVLPAAPPAPTSERVQALEAMVERAFRDGLSYATNVTLSRPEDHDLAWFHSRARAALLHEGQG